MPLNVHLMYIHPSISIDLHDCMMGGSLPLAAAAVLPPGKPSLTAGDESGRVAYGVHHYATNAAKSGADHVRIVSCQFRNMDCGILTSGGGETVEVCDCSFDQSTGLGIRIRNPAIVENCIFRGCGTGISTLAPGGPYRIHINGCHFIQVATGIDTGQNAMAGSQWFVDHCSFAASPTSGQLIYHAFANSNDTSQSSLRIYRCTFEGRYGAQMISGGKRLIVEESRFAGKWHAISIVEGDENSKTPSREFYLYRVTLRANVFTVVAPYHAFNAQNVVASTGDDTGECPYVFIDGSENVLNGSTIYLRDNDRHRGAMRAKQAIQGVTRVISGSGDLDLDWDHDEYNVQGATLKNVKVGAFEGTRGFGGWVKLHAVGSFNIATGGDGNIAWVKHSALKNLDVIRLVRDPASRLWYEV